MRSVSFRSIAVVICVFGLSSDAFACSQESMTSKRFVAAVWVKPGASGAKEVVVEPDVNKLKARGLTLDLLSKALRGRRFVAGNWTLEINGKNIDLDRVAKLTVRELQSPPFTVKLPDGRDVLITPDPKRIADYVVTGEYFEQDVRRALADATSPDPAIVYVLQMIPVPGTLPRVTEVGTGTHLSLGGPLKDFAELEIQTNR
jgi:hypothetical protein